MGTSGYELGIGLADEHRALADSVRGFAERHLDAAAIRGAVDAKNEWMPKFWPALAEQGLLGLHVPEEHGGQGFSLVELAVVLEGLGRAGAPGPFLPTVLAAAALVAADGKAAAELLPGLTDGTVTAAVGLEPGLSGTRTAQGLVVQGTTAPVVGGVLADVLVLPVRTDAGEQWIAVDADQVTVTEASSVDVVRRVAGVAAAEVVVPAERVLDGLTTDRVRQLAAVLFAAEAVGVAAWCVSTAAEYAKVREQFGRPIGQFQGVKHKCAGMAILLEQARALVWDAVRAVAAGEDTAGFAVASAAATAPEAAVTCAQDCIQVLGGIGFTWEHDAHLYYRRALTLRGVLGGRRGWTAEVARQALAGVSREIEIDLSPEAEPLRERIRAELAEIAAIDDPEERLTPLGDGGWVQPHLPEPWGRAAGPEEQIVIHQELREAGIQLPELGLGAWAVPPIATFGTEEQKQRFVATTLRGEIFWCQLFSEPGAGSDLASLRTRAERVEDGWRLTGQKIWNSLAQVADWAICLARTDPDVPKHDGITYFVVDMSAPGVTVRPLKEITGAALFNEVFLDDVFVPDDCVIGEVNQGWAVARATLASERVALGKGNALYATLKDLLAFARDREVGEILLQRLGELVCENQAIEALHARTILQQLSGMDTSTSSNVSKFLGMRFGQKIAELCQDELGAAGVFEAPGQPSGTWIDHLLSSRAMTIYGGTTEIQLNVIGERLLGLPRDPVA
ncbi:acyl-CoA dehydrogenase [Amycolatopsis anabasis]|uniref:acyl-CoA dehydrogenase n=1 Tax=Amycolatopsis anabasis TaxID=1840409 RepID=UPI00131D1548|nr:acyl-CoA dehydrogenase [Amycolatopsis anabasis]